MAKAKKANLKTLETLKKLSQALVELDNTGKQKDIKLEGDDDVNTITKLLSKNSIDNTDKGNEKNTLYRSLPLSHWRELPNDVKDAYQLMEEGAQLISATSTKYTLVTKISPDDGCKLASDLLKGAELIATGTFVLHSPSSGCGQSCRSYAKKSARSIMASLSGLIESFLNGEFKEDKSNKNNKAAQKTGAVWNACDEILLKKIPKGNRASMRRDLMIWVKECNETIYEFQQMIDLGPASSETISENDLKQNEKEKQDDDEWDDFMDDDDDQFSPSHFPIAKAVLGIIKCSRGTINCILKTCEYVGDQVTSFKKNDNSKSFANMKTVLHWMSELHDFARVVGEGMTDLGALLYPPLELSNDANGNPCELSRKVDEQTKGLLELCDLILSNNQNMQHDFSLSNTEITELATKVRNMTLQRRKEAESAISIALTGISC